MDKGERDNTQDWLLPERSRPPLIGDLVKRIDEAMARARSSEAAAVSIGAAALDAADQARRAVDLAERAATAMFGERGREAMRDGDVAAVADPLAKAVVSEPRAPAGRPAGDEDVLRRFSARADRIVERLQALERVPVST